MRHRLLILARHHLEGAPEHRQIEAGKALLCARWACSSVAGELPRSRFQARRLIAEAGLMFYAAARALSIAGEMVPLASMRQLKYLHRRERRQCH